jgi:hypothetical protein
VRPSVSGMAPIYVSSPRHVKDYFSMIAFFIRNVQLGTKDGLLNSGHGKKTSNA